MVKLAVISAFEYRKGYDEDFSFYASDSKGGVNRLSLNRIQQKIKKLREDNDNVFVVAFPHWGEPVTMDGGQAGRSRWGTVLVDAGADSCDWQRTSQFSRNRRIQRAADFPQHWKFRA